jgi:motility quorum-sensing regulator / GCU-specific mRNA interferase toxin
MEKRKPHHDLKSFKLLFASSSTRLITQESRKNAVSLGYMDGEDLAKAIDKLSRADFYKSMTSYSDYTIWQDVYRYQDDNDNHLYIKIQFSVDRGKAILIQFKRDEGGK